MANYEKDFIKQLEEQMLTIEKQKQEIHNLRGELRDSYRKMDRYIKAWNDALGRAVAKALAKKLASFKAEISILYEKIKKLEKENARLKASINKDSSNSSKPPSTNGFKRIVNSRKKSGRKPGGQKGHKGHRIHLPENMDELVARGHAEKRIIDHTNGSEDYISRWEVDIETKVIYTEHRYLPGSRLPEEMKNEVSYGNNLKAAAVLLSNEGMIARERLAACVSGITHGIVCPSQATFGNFLAQFSDKLDGEIETIRNDLLNGEVMHVDETPMRDTQTVDYGEDGRCAPELKLAEGTTFAVTIRNYSNRLTTLYTANPKKDRDGVERDDILPQYSGILSHDHDKKYYRYGSSHATCGSHLLRELKGLNELYNCTWAGEMAGFLSQMNRHKNNDLSQSRTECDREILSSYILRYDELLEAGDAALTMLGENGFGYKELNAIVNRLRKYKESYLAFMKNYTAPFSNNLSERDLRPCKTKQKVSGCFRSFQGAEDYAKIRSFVSTVKKRGLDVLASISLVFDGTAVLS